jgi:uncharacterized repeat protein (TIGR03803 family)
VVIAKGGVLYGTTVYGGSSNAGTVFALTPPRSPGGSWRKRVLYNFAGGTDASEPHLLVIGKNGVLYGTTGSGGTSGYGTVFSLTPPTAAGGSWTEGVLYSFSGGSDGGGPQEGLVIGSGGVLYGTTYTGGGSAWGTVFSLTPPASPGGSWTEAVVYSFTEAPGGFSGPQTGVLIEGVLYGSTEYGGASGAGTVFSLTPPASPGGAWTETVLHSFTGADGYQPNRVIVSNGALYGTTYSGGASNSTGCFLSGGGCGTVFKLKP